MGRRIKRTAIQFKLRYSPLGVSHKLVTAPPIPFLQLGGLNPCQLVRCNRVKRRVFQLRPGQVRRCPVRDLQRLIHCPGQPFLNQRRQGTPPVAQGVILQQRTTEPGRGRAAVKQELQFKNRVMGNERPRL